MRVTHWLTFIAFVTLLVTGAEIVVSHPRFYWGETGNSISKPLFILPIASSRDTVPTGYNYVLLDQNGWSRYLHFQAAWVVVLTGLVYGIFGLWTGHFRKNLLPAAADRSWRAHWALVAKYLRRAPPKDNNSYNVLQRTAYLGVIFVLFPLVIWTGLALSPAFDSSFPVAVNLLGGRQSARYIALLCLGISRDLPHGSHYDGGNRRILAPHAGHDHGVYGDTRGAGMNRISRRKLITAGLAATAGVAGLAAADRLAERYGLIPPDSGGFFGPGETLTYAAQRLLTRHSLAREFSRNMISNPPFANEVQPLGDDFKRHQAASFRDWRLTVDGLVERPTSFSISDLKSLPISRQITEIACEEGWSYIAEWIGTPLREVLREVGPKPAGSLPGLLLN